VAYKALLIGASTYDDPAIGDLPFVAGDLRQLHAALSAREFASVEILEAPRGTIRTTVNARVSGFLREARRDDCLFVLLSGHGLHFEGADYLVPEDASFAVRPFADCCVEIGWHKELEESAAAQVVFLIDACREGFARDTKNPAGSQGWGRQQIAAALRRKVAYVYACAPAQVALFVRPTDTSREPGREPDSFSLFSRAVAEVVTGVPHTLDLADFVRNVQDRISALHAEYGKAGGPQGVHAVTDIAHADVTVLPGPPRQSGLHPWVRSVARHPAWERTPASPARDALKAACEALAGQLAADFAQSSAALRDDPWHDAELAARAQARMEFLVRRFGDAEAFSPTEAALTALLPLVGQAYWAHEAARRAGVLDANAPGADLDRFQAFTRSHPRLLRRLDSLDQAGDPGGDADRIRWWLFHRWLLHQPELYTGTALTELLALPGSDDRPGWIGSALSPARFARFLQDHRTAPFGGTGTGPFTAPDVVAASTGDEHAVRQDMAAALAKTAHALAVDPVDLSEIIAEHLGISDAVELTGLLATLRGSDWRGTGLGRSLNASCDHPAVQIALREHATRTDALLRDINRGATAGPLRSLPPYADADLVTLSGSTPRHLTGAVRFQLAEDRVQELLMGESLYGDRELAVRELYQNALDALRHRDARTQYLRRTLPRPPQAASDWTGEIAFGQGVDAHGRGYLQCRDNGVGMGVGELVGAFAQGGARFVDLPEYAEEQADWSQLDPPVELHPNSRFGIGVLSYFMLADEIEVRTCRFGRDGRAGRLLRVTIAGPGNLFRIEDLGQGDAPGTTVRLTLSRGRAHVSVVEVLERLLWVAPYRTVAEQGSRRTVWEPGVLGDPPEVTITGSIAPRWRGTAVQGAPDLWWADRHGVLLADGLYTSPPDREHEVPYGVIANLRWPHEPELSIDRTVAHGYDAEHVERSAIRAADAAAGSALFTPRWLRELSAGSLPIADAVAEAAARLGSPWTLGRETVPFGAVGYFPPDVLLLQLLDVGGKILERTAVAALLRCVPAAVLRKRLLTLYAAGFADALRHRPAPEEPVWARPSDFYLLNGTTDHRGWESRLRNEWCRTPAQGGSWIGRLPPERVRAVASTLSGLMSWVSADIAVDASALLDDAAVCGRTAGEIAERYVQYGYRVDLPAGLEGAGRADRPILRTLADPDRLLVPGAELTAAQVAYSAAMADRPIADVARRLTQLGFRIPDAPADGGTRWTPQQRALVKGLWDHVYERLPAADAMTVGTGQLVLAAAEYDLPVEEVADFLRPLGFRVPAPGTLPELTDDDRLLVTANRNTEPWVDRPVSRLHILAVAARTGRPPGSLVDRLRTLGFQAEAIPAGKAEQVARAAAVVTGAGLYRSGDTYIRAEDLWQASDGLPREVPAALRTLGYEPPSEPLRAGPQPDQLLPLTTPAQYDALTEYLRAENGGGEVSLSAMGFLLPPGNPEFRRNATAAAHLEYVLATSHQVDELHPEYTDVSLPSLAAIACARGNRFHHVAAQATALGFHHEASTWFPPPPGTT
jgi:hypothetical protein